MFKHFLTHTVRDAFRNKNGIMWEKFPRGQTPSPSMGIFRRNTVFFWRCPKVKKLKKIVNYVLASQDDFGMPKKLVKKHKQVGLRQTPPPLVWEKFPLNPVYFSEGVLYRSWHLRDFKGGGGVKKTPCMRLTREFETSLATDCSTAECTKFPVSKKPLWQVIGFLAYRRPWNS